MDFQYFGANCISVTTRRGRIVIDDNLASLGLKTVVKADDVALYTTPEHAQLQAHLTFDGPGEYEVAEVSITGIAARGHMDELGVKKHTMYKIFTNDFSVLVTGHIHPDINDALLEQVGIVDVLILPVGGSGYTLDPIGALKIIKEIEPKIVIPTHYDLPGVSYPVPQVTLDAALKDLAMEPKDRTARLKLKPADLSDTTQLIVLEKV